MDLRPAFGHRLRTLRVKKNLSQEQLAERAALHWTYISGIERGQRSPTLNILGRLAHALGLPLSRLVRGLADSDGPVPAPSTRQASPAIRAAAQRAPRPRHPRGGSIR